jgi:hypothetical protein
VFIRRTTGGGPLYFRPVFNSLKRTVFSAVALALVAHVEEPIVVEGAIRDQISTQEGTVCNESACSGFSFYRALAG